MLYPQLRLIPILASICRLFASAHPLHAGEIYSVQASLPNATEAQLRSSGNNYPTWVTQRYLQLPASITPRVRELAVQIASGKDNPYDIALAVTDWLRTNIQYSDTIPELPANREPIDWFLFDLKQGFCNYYATAEVVLLRIGRNPGALVHGVC